MFMTALSGRRAKQLICYAVELLEEVDENSRVGVTGVGSEGWAIKMRARQGCLADVLSRFDCL
jgi:hypothetical protein